MLRQNYALLLLLSAQLFSVVFSCTEDNYHRIINSINNEKNVAFLNAMSTLSHDFRTYDFSIDEAIPWKELKATMELLFDRQQIYSGTAKEDLRQVKITVDVLMHKYRTVTEQMFEWAWVANAKFKFYIENSNRLRNMTRIKHFTQDILDAGKSIMYPAICKLNNIVVSLIELKDKLKRIKVTVQKEVEGENLLTLNEALEDAMSKVAACQNAAEKHDLKPCNVFTVENVFYINKN